MLAPLALATSLHAGQAEISTSNSGDWCQWLQSKPGRIYQNKDGAWIQSFTLGGRIHYQAAWLAGTDEFGNNFNDNYEELRRFRLESKTRFLKFLTASLNVDLADDERFRSGASDDLLKGWEDHDLHWGFQGFDEATLEVDLGKATGVSWLKDASVTLGKMKLETGTERRQSSNEISTIERSDLSNTIGGGDSRPVGVLMEIDRKRWGAELGIFAGSDETNLTGEWDDGVFLSAGASWKPVRDLELRLQHVQAEPSAQENALGYASATVLGAVYEKDRWGCTADTVLGDNGNEAGTDRQGAFGGFVVIPWYWAIESRLQLVARCQVMVAEEPEGLRSAPRYLRAGHEDPLVDVNHGRGNELASFYAGANYLICGDRLKLMTGFSFDRLNTPGGDVYTRTLLAGLRVSF